MTLGIPQAFPSGSQPIPNTVQQVPSPVFNPPVSPEPNGPAWTAPQQAYLDGLAAATAAALASGTAAPLGLTIAQGDADLVLAAGQAIYNVRGNVVFTVDHALQLPANAPAGTVVEWADEVGALAAHNLNVTSADSKQIQSGAGAPPQGTAGTALAASYQLTQAAWGAAGFTVRFKSNGVFWKVM